MKAPLPLSKKVFKLHDIDLYQLLGSASEACFDDLVSLAAQMSRTPIAFVSLIDSNGHWLKSQIGVDRTFAHRYLNFCAAAICQTAVESARDWDSNSEFDLTSCMASLTSGEEFLAGSCVEKDEIEANLSLSSHPNIRSPDSGKITENSPSQICIPPQKSSVAPSKPHDSALNRKLPSLVAIVRDASTDGRFAAHPLALSHPFVKFYAGMPIVTSDGQILGVFSVMDCVARDLTKEAINAMQTLSRQVSSLVELRWQLVKAQKDTPEVEDIACQSKQVAEIVAVSRDITERQQLVASQQERSHLSTLQAKVGAALGQGGTIPAILKRCTEAMVEHLDATGASIWTLNPQTEQLELQAASGISQVGWEMKIQHWMLGEQGKLQTAPLSPLTPPLPSPVAYPLIVEERLVGVMALGSSQAATEGALEVLGWMANAIAVAIDRVKAREELLSRREGLLFGLASQMRNSLDLDKILDTAVNEIRSLLQIDQCYFL